MHAHTYTPTHLGARFDLEALLLQRPLEGTAHLSILRMQE